MQLEQSPAPSLLRSALVFCSFHDLAPPEQRLVEFLLLVPIAALIVCVWRNIIGIVSFGTFAPACACSAWISASSKACRAS